MEILIGFMELPALVADLNAMTGRGKVPLFPVGTFDHGTAGKIKITEDDLQAWAERFNSVGQDAPIDYDHSAYYGKGTLAAGWIKGGSAYVSDGFIWGEVEWTPQAADEVRSRQYRYISPEWNFDGKTADGRMKNVEIKAATLTNRPFFKGMPSVVASELSLADIVEFDHELDHVAASKKPYGNVTYADPGYQEDGKARYPIDTEEHVRAAWSYINQAKNAGRYKPGQLARIKARIRSAMKRQGAQVSDDMGDDEVSALLATVPVGAMNAEAPDEDDAPNPDDGNTNKRTAKGAEMDPKELAKLLGLPEDATTEQISTAIAEQKAKADAVADVKPEPETKPEPEKKDGESALAIAAAARQELHELKRETCIAEAVTDKKILPAEKDFYAGAFDRDPDGTRAYLASKAALDFGPVGSDQDTDGEPEVKLEALAAQEFGTQIDGTVIPVEPSSFKIHSAAMEILEGAGKLLDYTSDDYVAAVKQAERKTGIANVHTAMLPSKSTATV